MSAREIVMNRFLLSILCLGLAVGSECPALEVAEKQLDALLQRSRNGNLDSVLAWRLQALFLTNKAMLQMFHDENQEIESAGTGQEDLQEDNTEQTQDASQRDFDTALNILHQAHHLAAARYKAGFASIDALFETGAELYHTAQVYAMWYDAKDMTVPVPSVEELLSQHSCITKAAAATGDTERRLKADLLRYRYIERTQDKVVQLQKAKVEWIQNKLHAGMATQWELREAKLDLQESEIFQTIESVDAIRQRLNSYSTNAAAFYTDMQNAAAAGMDAQAAAPGRLLRARLRILNATASLQQLEKRN